MNQRLFWRHKNTKQRKDRERKAREEGRIETNVEQQQKENSKAKLATRKILAKGGKKFEEEAQKPEAFAVEISCIQAAFSKLFSRIWFVRIIYNARSS